MNNPVIEYKDTVIDGNIRHVLSHEQGQPEDKHKQQQRSEIFHNTLM
jgi:hypothetical protein